MAAGDVEVYGPFPAWDTAAIDTGLTGNGVVVADSINTYVEKGNLYVLVIKAA